jgi:acyl carrier protein
VTREQVTQTIEEVLGQITPDSDLTALAPDADLRDALELDSLDFLNFVEGLSKRTGQRIDEDDYPKLATMASATAFIAARSQDP